MADLSTICVTDDRTLADLAADWNALLCETPAATGFQSLAWIATCRARLAAGRALLTLVFRDGARTVGIVPAEIRGRRLSLIGEQVSNYLGPLYRPAYLDDIVHHLGAFLGAERRVALVDFHGLREGSPFLAAIKTLRVPGWSAPVVVETATCPYLDLRPGWAEIYGRRGGKQRANFARKSRGLERLGALEFAELDATSAIEAGLPRMFELFQQRWTGRHESSGFAGQNRPFHELAGPALAAAGHVRLSVLRLDDEIIAFAYGVRTNGVTSSYVLAHDDVLGVCSPGLLLLLRVLEAACARGDPEYDFSLGLEAYKDVWATGERTVHRVLLWRRGAAARVTGALAALGTRVWVSARAMRWLRDLRREGLGSLVAARPAEAIPDAPGLPAGDARAWSVYRISAIGAEVSAKSHGGASDGERAGAARSWSFTEMHRGLSPRLLGLAVDRALRGDTLQALFSGERFVGVVWLANPTRRRVVAGGLDLASDDAVYYHPVAAEGALEDVVRTLASVVGDLPALVVTPTRLASATPLVTFRADPRFRE